MERNTGPVNILLIGSRAWQKDFDAATNNADWDLVVSLKQLTDILEEKSFYHYRPQLTHGKLSVVHQSGAKMEFEIMEKLESAHILKSLSKERKETIKIQNLERVEFHHRVVPCIWAVQTNIPSKEALLVLKASHIYFPIHWRKNFLQLVSMMSSFSKCFSKVIKEDPSSSLLKELFQTRARETLHRIKSQVHLSVQRIHAPTIQDLKESSKGHYDREEFIFKDILQTKEDPSDTFYLPSTGLKLSKSAWLKYGQDAQKRKNGQCVGKSLIIHEQLVLLALHYYLPQQRSFGYLSKLKKEDQINELFMNCLETFVTQQLVPVTRQTEQHREYKSCFPISGADIVSDIYSSEMYGSEVFNTLPLATNAELSKTTFANPIVNWFIDNLVAEYDDIRASFAAFMKTRDELFTYKPIPVPNLPFEIIEMIQSSLHYDYALLAKLCRVNRAWNKYFSADVKWQAYCDKFDAETREIAGKHAYAAHRRRDCKFLFRELCELMPTAHAMNFCHHCHDLHKKVSSYNSEKVRFDYEGRCACPGCKAASGDICQYYNDFLYSEG